MAGPTVAQLAQQATARDAAQALKDEAQKKEIEKMMQFIEELKAQLAGQAGAAPGALPVVAAPQLPNPELDAEVREIFGDMWPMAAAVAKMLGGTGPSKTKITLRDMRHFRFGKDGDILKVKSGWKKEWYDQLLGYAELLAVMDPTLVPPGGLFDDVADLAHGLDDVMTAAAACSPVKRPRKADSDVSSGDEDDRRLGDRLVKREKAMGFARIAALQRAINASCGQRLRESEIPTAILLARLERYMAGPDGVLRYLRGPFCSAAFQAPAALLNGDAAIYTASGAKVVVEGQPTMVLHTQARVFLKNSEVLSCQRLKLMGLHLLTFGKEVDASVYEAVSQILGRAQQHLAVSTIESYIHGYLVQCEEMGPSFSPKQLECCIIEDEQQMSMAGVVGASGKVATLDEMLKEATRGIAVNLRNLKLQSAIFAGYAPPSFVASTALPTPPPAFVADAGRGKLEQLEKQLKESRTEVHQLQREKKLQKGVPFKGKGQALGENKALPERIGADARRGGGGGAAARRFERKSKTAANPRGGNPENPVPCRDWLDGRCSAE
ncbi:hypothetical protein T484DRAFT_1797918, partial [Baffinella frigidus]